MRQTVDRKMSPALRQLSRHILEIAERRHRRANGSASWSDVDALLTDDYLRYSEENEDTIRELIECLVEDASPLEHRPLGDDSSTTDEDSHITLTDPARMNAYLTLLGRNRTDPIEQTN